ncbi:hypothetical protein O7627_31750 [Solwaraspora sp. WMMD1047]|uniref:hypothetical protein n=1 Tax=Solwaraspora sp. WMMD1047 TaxID=3016102 RepID=UPI0024174733|nr:hypothetical protein [Solwaraspora sp. WMMD1047]MDG4833851.1 hypothetical protein [Solwaraspora sp. WMMD1047]
MNGTADQVLTVIALISIPTVMFGGHSLLRLLATEKLTDFQKSFFRAGHAHAGVLLVMTLVALDVAARAALSANLTWTVGGLLLAGTLVQSGGMFIHMGVGQPGRWSWGNTVSSVGAVALAAGLLLLAWAVATA